ncbi:MAG: glycosyltransferase family 4 protein [Gammaproteobacteria bacterium]|nr:glycosyltransferase family 4 protein [Gammaproteobacteria bacterium]
MNVVIAHNYYRSSIPSGENVVVDREVTLLQEAGIDCSLFKKSNDALDKSSLFKKLAVAWRMAGSASHKHELKNELEKFGPAGILHAHNVMPLFGYDLFEAAKELGYQTIQTLHNYQLIACSKGFYSKTGIKEPQNPLEVQALSRVNAQSRGVIDYFYQRAYQKVWRDNKIQSIDKFICLTEFQKKLMIQSGLPENKLFVKPNFLPDNGLFKETAPAGGYAIFVGRLAEEKGVLALTEAWKKLSIPLYVVGSGPLGAQLPKATHIHYLGQQSQADLLSLISRSRFLVMNSTWYEPFGLVAIEALSVGVPCLLPKLAALPEFVQEGRTGYCFEAANMTDLAEKAGQLWGQAVNMRADCRADYLARFTPQINLQRLLQIYQA